MRSSTILTSRRPSPFFIDNASHALPHRIIVKSLFFTLLDPNHAPSETSYSPRL
jgi:hypothetical protein